MQVTTLYNNKIIVFIQYISICTINMYSVQNLSESDPNCCWKALHIALMNNVIENVQS